MIEYKALTSIDNPTFLEKKEIADFLKEHLDEYGDTEEDILKCLDYSLSNFPHQGGFTLLAKDKDKIVGAAVLNHTGMEGYIPENILVYIAVHNQYRNQGIAKELMNRTIKLAKGDIALHVEHDNPAKHLYEKYGFENKYLEMRLKNK